MSEWMPIESAPKGEVRLLLWQGGVILGYAICGSFREYLPGKPDWRCDSGALLKPTHWMKLPEPPVQS